MYEREDIIAWRERYLRKMMEIRKSLSTPPPPKKKQHCNMDETWLNEDHRTKKKEWTDLTTLCRKNLRSLKSDGLTGLSMVV